MFDCPNMLMIGSTGRNVGKTEFACRLIARLAPSLPVIGLKITTIRERGGACPRGGEGCGVCGALKGDFCISEELARDTGKDTSRLLKAGATRVFWLRAQKECLAEGFAALLQHLPAGAPIVCESNAAREFIRPGAFLVVRESPHKAIKPSCREVIELADRVFDFHGDGWDFQPDQCHFTQGRWFLPFDAAAAILAGGQSRRMGQDKSLLPINDQPMIACIAAQLRPLFPELLVSSNDPEHHAFLGLPLVADGESGQGPLRGILSCLEACQHELLFVTACDMPQLPLAYIAELLELAQSHDVVIPVDADGRHEPLFAVYRKTLVPRARQILAAGGRRIIELLPGHRAACPLMPGIRSLNTPQEYRLFLEQQ